MDAYRYHTLRQHWTLLSSVEWLGLQPPDGFTIEFAAQDHLRKRRNLDFGAAQPGQVQPLLGDDNIAEIVSNLQIAHKAQSA